MQNVWPNHFGASLISHRRERYELFSKEMRENSDAANIVLEEASKEKSGSIGLFERYHDQICATHIKIID